MPFTGEIKKIDETTWEIPKTGNMLVPGLIFSSSQLLNKIMSDESPKQVANVAHLPGIVKYAMAMPDVHWGYGFPIGGVAAFRIDDGVISPGGVGSDINCGVRLIRTNLTQKDIGKHLQRLMDTIFSNIPCGIGTKGKIRLSRDELKNVLVKGSIWAMEHGYGTHEDIESTENSGCLENANPEVLSSRALERGLSQLGTLGAGNHFIEIQVVDEVRDDADKLGLFPGQVTVMIHSGSRGLGYQVCDDYLDRMGVATRKYDIHLPDRQLACAPITSPEGREYYTAMASAANYAWANRQIIMHWVRESFEKNLGSSWENLGMYLIWDVAHNIAKFEKHIVDGIETELCVHRKGATRAFGPENPEIPEKYRTYGQPVIIPGDMGTASYVLFGTTRAQEITWGSTCHGAGRLMSRRKALKITRGRRIDKEMQEQGILVKSRSSKTLGEECSEAYKDIDEVVSIVKNAGLSRVAARLIPIGVIKG